MSTYFKKEEKKEKKKKRVWDEHRLLNFPVAIRRYKTGMQKHVTI
jgi:hypothetical protein